MKDSVRVSKIIAFLENANKMNILQILKTAQPSLTPLNNKLYVKNQFLPGSPFSFFPSFVRNLPNFRLSTKLKSSSLSNEPRKPSTRSAPMGKGACRLPVCLYHKTHQRYGVIARPGAGNIFGCAGESAQLPG